VDVAPTSYLAIQARILGWVETQPAIWAVLQVGSRAREIHPADEWANIDLIFYTNTPKKYVTDPIWLNQIGPVWAKTSNTTERGEAEWLVLYKGGFKVDYFLAQLPATISPQTCIGDLIRSDPFHHNVFTRGVRILFSRFNPESAPQISPLQRIEHSPIDQQSFFALTNHILLAINRVAKLLRRGDILRAWHFSQVELKNNLLTLIEWHTRAKRGAITDTWYDGRFITDWCDPQILKRFYSTFARCDAEELWQALFNAHALFSQLVVETAEKLALEYASEVGQEILDWNKAVYANR
jgi:aminoglycoside 6-adenylyltransferase